MKFSEENLDAGYFITGYDTQRILVNGKAFHTSLVIAPDQLVLDWSLTSVETLTREHMQRILELQPELVLVGTGDTLKFPELANYAALINRGIGVETMDTGAACRTYNILMAEGRRVVAGLIMPE